MARSERVALRSQPRLQCDSCVTAASPRPRTAAAGIPPIERPAQAASPCDFVTYSPPASRPTGRATCDRRALSGCKKEQSPPASWVAVGLFLARATGVEPATTGSTVRYSNQLSYAPTPGVPHQGGPGTLAVTAWFAREHILAAGLAYNRFAARLAHAPTPDKKSRPSGRPDGRQPLFALSCPTDALSADTISQRCPHACRPRS